TRHLPAFPTRRSSDLGLTTFRHRPATGGVPEPARIFGRVAGRGFAAGAGSRRDPVAGAGSRPGPLAGDRPRGSVVGRGIVATGRSEEHTSELQSRENL